MFKPSIFDQVARDTPSGVTPFLIKAVIATMGGLIVLSPLIWQLASINARLSAIEEEPPVVQVGQDAKLISAERLNPEQNAKEFIKEALPALFAWSKRVTKDVHPSGIDPGRNTRYGNLPTLIDVYSNALTPPYRDGFRQGISDYKPQKFEQGEARLLNITRIATPKKTAKGWEVMVFAELIDLDENDDAYASTPFNNVIHLVEVDAPKKMAAYTPIEQIYAEVRGRGLMISRIQELNGREIQ
ncbi:MAG: hypothetical protein HC851_20255 [Acaryochloris sp. RU_4_1]|nr:hypothetical protein [Acaryochloris sp. RU_4_1]NJR56198.1 hypothetical protein [Acaryochloris sp. CRU_2_0]